MKTAFTLIELVLVCVVIAVLLAGTAPRFSRTAERLRLEQSAFELTQLLRLAHGRAVTEGQAAQWSWNEATRRARVALIGETASAREASPLPGRATLRVVRGGQPVECLCVQFYPDGTAEETMITLSAETAEYIITVHAATSAVVLATGPTPR